ncbi:helix-turn-helix domain-containing protein [Nocardia sp. NPDC050710]|uniref:GbsR/MarR family transcriptional regulator n=1 Tax=Nocardia sp. NPDC050710 TaxID=3157220 RepID=UPI0033C42D6F
MHAVDDIEAEEERMPGERLTDEDRQQIAEGLAEGLSLAEIARRLARPTSTIAREVSRNGGLDGYRADHAQQATGQRARRSGSATRPTAAAERKPQAERDFEEWFGAVLAGTGLPRMMARVLARLCTTDSGSLTAAELTQQLQVSPASISNAVIYLEEQQMIRRERDPLLRRDRYIIDDDALYRSWLASARANLMLAEAVQQGAQTFGVTSPAGARLHDMGEFLGHVGNDMMQAAERWWASR